MPNDTQAVIDTAENLNMTLGEFNAEVYKGRWIKPRELLHWLKDKGVPVTNTAIYAWATAANNRLPTLKIGGALWLRKEWVNAWLDARGGEVYGVKVTGRLK